MGGTLFQQSHIRIFQVAADRLNYPYDGRTIWGRRDCDSSSNPGPNSHVDSGCDARLVRALVGGTDVPLPPWRNSTWTASALHIDVDVGCPAPSCTVLGPNCPFCWKDRSTPRVSPSAARAPAQWMD
ncbi:hypothetical protein B0H14DRAFT_2568521 [Mycena olivaceomarginata]|nr:hypothetical protein B0H14DRAFT_2568521 [Mycena olivaceomarginata]